MDERAFRVKLANTLQEVANLAQLHHESQAFADAQERVAFLHQMCCAVLEGIHRLRRWQALALTLQNVDALHEQHIFLGSALKDELLEPPDSLATALVAGNIAYVQFVAQLSGILAIVKERKFVMIHQLTALITRVLIEPNRSPASGSFVAMVDAFVLLAQSDTPEVYALCQPIMIALHQQRQIDDRDDSNYARHGD